MSMGIDTFRAGRGDRIILDQPIQNATGVQKAVLPFKDRVVNFFKSGDDRHGTVQQQTENREFKVAFLAALVKAEGHDIARRAVEAAGLKPGWALTSKPMSEKQVKLVLEKAQQFRKQDIQNTQHNINAFLKRNTPPSFGDTFLNSGTGLPQTDVRNKDLHALFRREVKLDPNYGKRLLDGNDMQAIALRAIQKFEARKVSAFREQHPGLAQFVQQGHLGTPREDQRSFFPELIAKLTPGMAQGHALSTEPRAFRTLAQQILGEIQSTKEQLSKMAYNPEGWQAFENELNDKYWKLVGLEHQLGQLAGNDLPQGPEGQDLMQALATELRQQQDLLMAKAGFLDDVQDNDPLSQKMVSYSNLLWAQAAGKIFDEAIVYVTNNPPQGGSQQAIAQLTQAKNNFIAMQQQNYNNAPRDVRTDLPGTISKDQHPTTLGKTGAKGYLEIWLTQAGVPRDQIKELTNSDNLSKARRLALNENQTWAPVSRDMVVTRDGVTRTYRSKITPGGSINPRFARRYQQVNNGGIGVPPHSPREGVSSATKSDHYHARNLKVSELERVGQNGQTTSKVKVIGHGVLDMWDIVDPTERQEANKRGAHEVLEAAISTNDRILTEALNRAQNGNPNPVKITHVSVNLITPAGWRELPGMVKTDTFHDYQEQTYTRNQFQAFHENSTEGTGGPVTFQVDDSRPGGLLGQDVNINVDVDVISFSFGINPIATGKMPDFMGGWDSVYEHNRGMMVKFVGDLGEGEFGSVGSRPGGFIGSVLDHLDPNVPQEAELIAKIQEQTDVVRSLFTSEDFKRGNGDPAKMGRHILALQGLAEEVLSLKNVTDQAATMSKGCKSDKDRGGVTDVELKHQLITEDMGGQITPDMRLEGDDQQNYYVVATGSGQLENQLYNTGLPGSKEAGKLGTRIPDPIVRQYLSGLGSFAAE